VAGETYETVSGIAAQVEELVAEARSTPARRPPKRTGQAAVFLYHRIAEATTDPFELAVPPALFREHLEVLSSLGPILPVSELSKRIANGKLTDVSFAVTFDDGYADNLHTAKPILEQYGVPATVFVATGCGGKPFWWDELADLILTGGGGEQPLALELDGVSRGWHLKEGERQPVYHELWQLLRPLDHDHRRQAIASLCSQLGRDPQPAERSLTPEEIPQLARGGLVDVGAHTETHPVLASISDEAARDEIYGSKAWLEGCLGRPVSAFSYPYGDYSARDVEIVRQAGFEIAFSTVEEAATPACDRLQVPRVTVGGGNGADLERTITRLLGSSRTTTARPGFAPEAGKVDFGDLRRLKPVGRDWGFDRGTPVDRYYIERFLEPRAGAIRGHVLEMADPQYAEMFGGDRVTQLDVLDVTPGAVATYTCRLEEGDEIPTDTFDCIVCTQVLQYIYDARGALRTLHRILKPGGRLLLTVPAITPIHEPDQYGDSWYWSFTARSTAKLCGEFFSGDAIDTEVFGNLLAASAFLFGLAASELTQEELGHVDPDYPVIVAVHAVK
jgi:peptidoglycan/xylan/chitin deacetylase (PgdA/CDA1 family)/SAM-dependent methyltransferase